MTTTSTEWKIDKSNEKILARINKLESRLNPYLSPNEFRDITNEMDMLTNKYVNQSAPYHKSEKYSKSYKTVDGELKCTYEYLGMI